MLLNRTAKTWLTDTFAQNVIFGEPMSRHTSFRVGGPAEAFVTPAKRDDLVRLVQWAYEHGIAYMTLGAGSNILVKDGGIDGIVILLNRCLKTIVQTESASRHPIVTAEAGVKLTTLCSYAADRGLKGMNCSLGIPGTVGGGIQVNAGTRYGCLGDLVESIRLLLPGGTTRIIAKKDLHFSYRTLDWPVDMAGKPGNMPVILEGSFRLERADKRDIRNEAEQILKHRKQSQPWRTPNAGCIFKNPDAGQSAGQLIDIAGLKGRRIGDAEVSTTHANFIVNRGRASAGDILALMDLIRKTVYEHSHIQLEAEVRIVG